MRTRLAAAPDRGNGAEQLCAALGYLPIALAQVAAYLLDSPAGLDCAAYRDRLADQSYQLIDLIPEARHLPDQHQAILTAVWTLSIEHADQLRPIGLSRPVLELIALLDPNGIPGWVLTAPPITAYLRQLLGRAVDIEGITGALHTLHRLNLITVTDTGTVRVHALVQRATRDHTSTDRRERTARAAADALLSVWPDPENNPAGSQALRANTEALYRHTGDTLLYPRLHNVLDRSVRSIGDSGQVAAAATETEALLADLLRVLGPDHPDTLTTRANLARWLGNAGEPASVVATAFNALLADRLRVLVLLRRVVAFEAFESFAVVGGSGAFAAEFPEV
ncbi:hypothetical protein [Actinoplanes cyaneus]|uniref:hypothetical protein n=1 Tax=Actinoplanes cyaneus TaxID=52696 RepID=UPI002226A574|nr:hypothetical protein [Actinoplanes cyaneus]MCW2144250.1 hypothetical protein [Actinoplanes cyaneus]